MITFGSFFASLPCAHSPICRSPLSCQHYASASSFSCLYNHVNHGCGPGDLVHCSRVPCLQTCKKSMFFVTFIYCTPSLSSVSFIPCCSHSMLLSTFPRRLSPSRRPPFCVPVTSTLASKTHFFFVPSFQSARDLFVRALGLFFGGPGVLLALLHPGGKLANFVPRPFLVCRSLWLPLPPWFILCFGARDTSPESILVAILLS